MALISSEKGLTPWKHQRLTAVILLFAVAFFIYAFCVTIKASQADIILWLQKPLIKGFCLLSLGALFYHSFLGLKMIVEDYLHHKHLRQAVLFLMLIAHVFFTLLGGLLILSF